MSFDRIMMVLVFIVMFYYYILHRCVLNNFRSPKFHKFGGIFQPARLFHPACMFITYHRVGTTCIIFKLCNHCCCRLRPHWKPFEQAQRDHGCRPSCRGSWCCGPCSTYSTGKGLKIRPEMAGCSTKPSGWGSRWPRWDLQKTLKPHEQKCVCMHAPALFATIFDTCSGRF